MHLQGKLAMFALVSLLICELSPASEADSTAPVSTVQFRPGLRSIQVDATIFLFTAAYSGSVDIDFLQTGRQSALGIRTGVERFVTGGPGGPSGGSPYLDYNVLVRSTLSGESLRFDAFLGCAYHTSDLSQYYPSMGLVKYGAEFRWKIAPGVFGLLAKANGTKSAGTVGVGLYLGWDQ
jgi:hypothetical protein